MKISFNQLIEIEKGFHLNNGAWTKEAVAYVGLKYPLQKGWKLKLLAEGVSDSSPFAKGVPIVDHLWVNGADICHIEMYEEEKAIDTAVYKDPHAYVMSQLSALETVINDLRLRADELKNELRELRKTVSKDEF